MMGASQTGRINLLISAWVSPILLAMTSYRIQGFFLLCQITNLLIYSTLKEEALQQLQTSSSITHFVKNYNSIVSIIAFKESAEFLSFTASSPFRLIGISDSTPSAPTMTGMLNETPSMP